MEIVCASIGPVATAPGSDKRRLPRSGENALDQPLAACGTKIQSAAADALQTTGYLVGSLRPGHRHEMSADGLVSLDHIAVFDRSLLAIGRLGFEHDVVHGHNSGEFPF